MKKGFILECYGCKQGLCSMCPVYNSNNEIEAIRDFILTFGLKKLLGYLFKKCSTNYLYAH